MEGELKSDPATREMTDQDRADFIRSRLRPHLEDIARIFNEAKAQGLSVSYQMGLDANGVYQAPPILVSRLTAL